MGVIFFLRRRVGKRCHSHLGSEECWLGSIQEPSTTCDSATSSANCESILLGNVGGMFMELGCDVGNYW